jgi:glycosyltransferase involved in cell wall biosynthesis
MPKLNMNTYSRSRTPLTPLTVVHVVEGCQGGVGSAVRHLIDLQCQDPGIGEVHLVADRRRMGDMLHGVPATLHEYESARSPHLLLQVSRRLQRQLMSIAPDVVYLHSTFPGLYGRLRWRKQTESWVTVYCAHGWAFTQQLSFPARKLYTIVERILARRTDAIVSISYAEFDAAVKGNVSAPLHRVIYHGVPGRKESLPSPVSVDADRLNLAFIGRFDRQKGLDLLLQAFADPKLGHVTLWLIGGSTLGQKYSIPEQPNVKLIGWVPNTHIDEYICCFDAVIIPSRWEGFGLIALETMRNGKPVLASRTGGLAELVIDRVNGRLFNPGDAKDLTRVLLDISKSELARMGKMADEIFHTGFKVTDCYSRWSALTQDALALRMKARRPEGAASHMDPVTTLPLEEL